MNKPHRVNSAHRERRAERAAPEFEAAGFVHAMTLQGLIERLEPMSLDARVVVDLGCGTGASARALQRHFRGARIVATDRSQRMLQEARAKRRWFSRVSYVRADPESQPLPDHSVDVVFSNLALTAVADPAAVAREVARVLRKDGLFVLATLGPDSLGVLRRAWQAVDEELHVQRFMDMHDLGDLLVQAGLRDPVLDVDRLRLEYASSAALFRDLTATGARNSLADRRPTLTGRRRFARMTTELESARSGGTLGVELELVYGHCWGSGQARSDREVRIAPGAIGMRRPPVQPR
jgi:malonyl-CoA O-methyltransferase